MAARGLRAGGSVEPDEQPDADQSIFDSSRLLLFTVAVVLLIGIVLTVGRLLATHVLRSDRSDSATLMPAPAATQSRPPASTTSRQPTAVRSSAAARNEVPRSALVRQSLTLDGLGPLRIGMTLSQVQRALDNGAVDFRQEPGGRCAVGVPQGAPQGLSLMFQDGRLVRVDVAARTETATKSGVRVGDPEARVHRLYTGRISVAPHPHDKAGHYLVFTPRDHGDANRLMIFETDGRRVTSFRAGLREAVQLTTPCG